MYPPLFVMQYQMPPGMPNTNRVKHIRRNLSPCLLKLPGELLDARNCLQLAGALLQNRPEIFSETGLCAVPRSDISHPEKSRLLQRQFCAFLVVRGEFSSDMKILCWHMARLCAWSRHITITVTSVTCGGQGNSQNVILCLGRRRTPLQIGL